MGIEIKIKQPEKKIDIYRIEELWKNACTNAFEGETSPRIGVQDDFYRMKLQFINTSKEYDEKNHKFLIQQMYIYYLTTTIMVVEYNYGLKMIIFVCGHHFQQHIVKL